jgi:hypothetical protein
MTSIALLQIHIRNLKTPLPVEVTDAPEILQVEFTNLQYDSILRSYLNQKFLVTLYASFSVSRFSEFVSWHDI